MKVKESETTYPTNPRPKVEVETKSEEIRASY